MTGKTYHCFDDVFIYPFYIFMILCIIIYKQHKVVVKHFFPSLFTSALSYLFLRPSGRFLFPTSVAGFMQAKSLKSGWRTRGSVIKI